MKNKIIIIIVALCTIIAIYINIRNYEKTKYSVNEENLVNNNINSNYLEDSGEEKEENMSVIEITSENFEEEVINSDRTVIIDFWAEWCGPCQIMSPIIEEIAEEKTDLKVCKVNIDNEIEIATKYSIVAIPTIVIIKNGEVLDTLVGVREKEEILEAVID